MNTSGDAAEQIVRMSLEGVEVMAKITGAGAKEIGLKLFTTLKQEQKTKGKARLTSMLKSGRELKVYSVRQEDLKKFSQEAKRYGVLYCVLKDRDNRSPDAVVDVIARADDASKIQRITERFKLATIDTAAIMGSLQKDKDRLMPSRDMPDKDPDELEWARRITQPIQKEESAVNPNVAKTEKSPLSEPDLKQQSRSNGSAREATKPSVREKLNGYRREIESAKRERAQPERGAPKEAVPNKPKLNKAKER
jgi:hypothetical protein